MNDNETPIVPEPQAQPVRPVPPASPAPRVTDITRVDTSRGSLQGVPIAAAQQPTIPAQTAPISTPVTAPAPVAPAPAPVEPLAGPLATPIAPPVSTPAPTPVEPTPESQDYEEEAEQSGNLADTMKTIFWGFINWVAAPLLIVFILHNFVFQAYHVDGSSMAPTLATSDYMIVSKVENTLAKLTGKAYIPRRHQVVVFSYPSDPSLIFIKRVTAVPGERVVVKDGKITVYNTENPEGFSPDDGSFERAATYTEGDVDEIVPEGSIFVVGDNRLPSGSFDSREWGMLPSKNIIGNSVIRLLPLDGFRFFNKIPEVVSGLN